ncbi:hypothetical protein [Streptomyces sp. NPDC003032]
MRTSGQVRVEVIQKITDRFFEGLDEVPLLEAVGLYDESVADDLPRGTEDVQIPVPSAAAGDPVSLAARYDRLCALVERREESRRGRRRERVSRDPIRSGSARRAVLLRSAGHRENPACGGHPADVTDAGDALLEVDHIVEIAGDGRDHPSQMIASARTATPSRPAAGHGTTYVRSSWKWCVSCTNRRVRAESRRRLVTGDDPPGTRPSAVSESAASRDS